MAELLKLELVRAWRTAGGFHLVTFDIDHFKAINDRHGTDVGDGANESRTSRCPAPAAPSG